MSLTLIALWSSAFIVMIIALTGESVVIETDDGDIRPKPPIHPMLICVEALEEGYATNSGFMYRARDRPASE